MGLQASHVGSDAGLSTNHLGSGGGFGGGGYVPTDPDAIAFFNAGSGFTDIEKMAVDELVISLKAANLWNSINILYPFVGRTASNHKFNLKDPRNLDAAYRLIFYGGWTHSSTGAAPNGINAWADTCFSPNIIGYNSNYHQAYYSRTNNSRTGTVEMGLLQNAITTKPSFYMYVRTSNLFGGRVGWNTTSGGEINIASTNSSGFFTNTKTGNTSDLHRNGIHQQTLEGWTSGSTTSGRVFLGAYHDVEGNLIAGYSNRECALASAGWFISESDIATYNSIVQTFQTTLGRNV